METPKRNFEEIQKGIKEVENMMIPQKNAKMISIMNEAMKCKNQIVSGLEDIKNGIEKIELESTSFDNDPWLWDWLTVCKNRFEIMSNAFNDHFKDLENERAIQLGISNRIPQIINKIQNG